MSSSTETVKALEEQLDEAGNKLLQPPSSLDHLLPLLDQVEDSLAKVEQSPAKSTHAALTSLMKALVSNELIRHPDVDVKVAVASCISEITRITAPDAPYDDDKMKDVFQLIVSAFENLSDMSSRSFKKRASILETVAKVRSCVIMLDLECDQLITNMFQYFFKTIRDDHPEKIVTSMETIMCLVLDESEDVSAELLTTLLSTVKRDNVEVSPIARKLGERVIKNCATKLKPYLIQAMNSLDISLDNYSETVSFVCERTIDQNNDKDSTEQLGDGSKPPTASSNETEELPKDDVELACEEDSAPCANRSPKSTISNGRREETSDKLVSVEKVESDEVTPRAESDDLKAEKTEPAGEQGGSNLNSSTKSIESSEPLNVNGEEEVANKDSDSSASDDASPEEAKNFEKEKATSDVDALQGTKVVSPSSSEGAHECHSQKSGNPRKKESLIQEDVPSPEGFVKEAHERTSDSETMPQKSSGKEAHRHETANKDKTSHEVCASRDEEGTTSDSEVKQIKQQGRKLDVSDNDEDGSSVMKKEGKKKRRRGRVNSGKQVNSGKHVKDSIKDDKEVMSSPKSPSKSSKEEDNEDEIRMKRKHSSGKEKASETMKYGKNLVGSKVKVWWPKDHMFYEGIIDSFDPVKKKHKVLYDDGDEETLNLRKERWQLIRDDSATDAEDEAEPTSTDASSEMQKKKKAKKSADLSMKHESDDILPKRGLSASSSKSKGLAPKSGKMAKDGGKADPKSKDGTSKSGGVLEVESGKKSKAHSQKTSGKFVTDSPKSSGKPKDLDSSMLKRKSKPDSIKTPGKSKEDTPKTVAESKGKTAQSGNKSSSNGVGKVKSGSSKVKDRGDVKEKVDESKKIPEGTKRKLSDSPKGRESERKSRGKKRQRKS